jgi:RNA polymerase sigma-70 factor, ECF subfamily
MMAAVTDEPTSRVPRDREIDTATLERCKKGDPLAFRAFVVRYERPVFALLSRMLGRGPHVEDLAQETFLRAFRAFGGFDVKATAKPSTWLLTIATRLAIDSKRKPTFDLATIDSSSIRTPEYETARAQMGRAIERAANELPDEQRVAFVLAEFHAMSVEEIAAATDTAEATVKTRLFRAREKLRSALAQFRQGEK